MLNTLLNVKRKFSDGSNMLVGQLAENKEGVYFQYDDSYLASHPKSLSPFLIKADNSLQKAPKTPHYGLHGVFGDSLPDGWGLYLMDRVFRANGYNPKMVTALKRLAYMGERCSGALYYEPVMSFSATNERDIDLITLGKEAVKEFEGMGSVFLNSLMDASGSGGARPKLNVTKCANGLFSTHADAIGEKLIIKLTSDRFSLQHSESLVEYAYMKMARNVGIEVPDFELLAAGNGRFWLQQARFDCSAQGRYHMISACGLLDAPFREPSLDYIDLARVTRHLCGVEEAQKLVKRAFFNYLTVNQDDHAKNFAFLADDTDNWRLSPFYDVVYMPSPYNEHMTSFNGNGKVITPSALEQLAGQAGFSGITPLKNMLEEIYDETHRFQSIANELEIDKSLAATIAQHMEQKWSDLKI
ncbi:type II toxin-antitoxin system HipA family toxin [Xenorhabdus sp. IM139775]|uniref:type II toxin-antitoxin system HipA family toxin n=1 Tax=Xenorhabdus sp. IM139775 TaxID=3025876 RepID=UPI002359D9CF|nr:type II toxin-antitoxin system HipA family toxin [Xenorhabdus sp. IM139775]MDC9592462.1 type II toxin-antitoxin system HipA family toxin [Xenorhabdus sp. IM139775]